MSGAVLSLKGLRVETTSGIPVVDGVDLSVANGEILGLVGESGSGKTTTALSVLGWTGAGLKRTAGEVIVEGRDSVAGKRLAKVRGRLVTYVPQSPGTSLNPSTRITTMICEMIDAHPRAGETAEPLPLLGAVGLPSTSEFGRRYRHQLSGGQQQRVCIAVALASNAPVVVLDEPTTGLDVVTQARVLDELQRLRLERGLAMIYVSHDLSVVAQIADRIAVMYAGRIVETGPVDEVLTAPKHPYTRGLIASIPDHQAPGLPTPMLGHSAGASAFADACAFTERCPLAQPHCSNTLPALERVAPERTVRCFESAGVEQIRTDHAPTTRTQRRGKGRPAPVLEVRNLRAEHPTPTGAVVAAENVSFDVFAGECVALVGESGSGKTTIARTIAGLHEHATGRIALNGDALSIPARKRRRDECRRIQIVFQNPTDALNPRHTVSETLQRPLAMFTDLRGLRREDEVKRLLDSVRLPQRFASRYPTELSGGERQRVGVARALAAKPELMICDEVTSALDVSVQAALLGLLDELKQELQLSLLFITHDFGVVAALADRVLVLEQGLVCEEQPTDALLQEPSHPYTTRLLNAAPSLSSVLQMRGLHVDIHPSAPSRPNMEEQHG